MSWPHFVRVTSPETVGATSDRDTGWSTPADTDEDAGLLYHGPADVQDEGAVVSRRVETSEEDRQADATIFYPDHVDVSPFKPGSVVRINYKPREPGHLESWDAEAEIRRTVRLDGKSFVRYVE